MRVDLVQSWQFDFHLYVDACVHRYHMVQQLLSYYKIASFQVAC